MNGLRRWSEAAQPLAHLAVLTTGTRPGSDPIELTQRPRPFLL